MARITRQVKLEHATAVIVVRAGPVGLALANELGYRGSEAVKTTGAAKRHVRLRNALQIG